MANDENLIKDCKRELYDKFIEEIMKENECKRKSDSERIKDYVRKLETDYSALNPTLLDEICETLNVGIGNVRQLFEFLSTSVIAVFALLVSVMTLLFGIIKKNDACCSCQNIDFSMPENTDFIIPYATSDCLIDVLIVIFLIFIVIAFALWFRKCFKKLNMYEQIGLNTVYFKVALLLEKERKNESDPEAKDID